MAKAKTKKVSTTTPDTIPDLASLVQGIENVTEKQAMALIPQLRENMHYSYYALGGLLVLVQDNLWWKNDPAQYESFKDYVEQAHGISRRKAFYFMKIYTKLTLAEVPLDDILKVGWTKLKEIADVICKENLEAWIECANNTTTMALRAMVKESLKGTLEATDVTPAEKSSSSKITFTLHADQKAVVEQAIEQGKGEAGTEYASVALDGICQAYLSGAHTMTKAVEAPAAPQADLATMMAEAGIMEVLELVEQVFKGASISVTLPEGGVEAEKPAPKKKPAAKKPAKKKAAAKKPVKGDISNEL